MSNVNDAAERVFGKNWKPMSPHEWFVFWSIVYASPQYSFSGENLWLAETDGWAEAPDFGKVMPLRRFQNIKRFAAAAFADMDNVTRDPWQHFRPVVEVIF